jgi:ABC-type uncharacterized transport system involved in gliding motility auxiliary subunit
MQKLRQNSDYILSLGLIGVFVPLIVYLLRHQFNIFGKVVFALGILCLILYIALDYARLLRALGGRQVRYGGNAVLMSVLFIGIIALLVFMSQRYSKRIDLTSSHSFSVSQQTTKVLDNLAQSVKVWAFFGQADDKAGTEPLLKSYQAASNGKLTYEFVDPDAHPTQARQYGLATGETGILILESGAKQQKVTGNTESDITSGLLKISSDKQKAVYFLTGHGERAIDDTSGQGLQTAQQALQKDNYIVKTLSLLTGPAITSTTNVTATSALTSTQGVTVSGSAGTTAPRQVGSMPADASVLVITAPQVPIGTGEWQVISQWLENGGKLFLMTDALDGPSGLEDALLANWGVSIRNDLVIDPAASLMGDAATLVVRRGSFSPITKDLKADILFPGARSVVEPQTPPQGETVTPLAQSSEQSWGETSLTTLNAGVRYDAGKDAPGPLDIAISVEKDAPNGAKARLIVSGNARFAIDSAITNFANLDFFVNSVNWLAQDEQLIAIRPTAPTQRTLNVPPGSAQLLSFGVVGGLPLLVLALGTVVWWRRR